MSSWLLKDEGDRERMVDMDRRLAPVRRTALAVLGVALIASGPWLGWWTLVPLLFAALLFNAADSKLETMRRPEYGIFAAWAAAQVVIAVSVALANDPSVPTLSWLAIPIVTLSARFSHRGIVAGVIFTLVLLVLTQAAIGIDAVFDNPPVLLAPAALVIAVAILSTALMHSDVEHRTEAVIDGLTGMLNRKALATRADELAQQSAITGEPVAVIVADLDHFKQVNDSVGHGAGDHVLKDVGYSLRKELRAFDLAYRLGGEEFVVLLPGSELEGAVEMAERLRAGVSRQPSGPGLTVTVSCGVAASGRGEAFSFERVFEAADAALYEAKRSGRDRVCVAGGAGTELKQRRLEPGVAASPA